ncbi:MAG: signal peptidase II [Clostridia bacterium]|nr:signal peptidase II [Clostridia bacterium]
MTSSKKKKKAILLSVSAAVALLAVVLDRITKSLAVKYLYDIDTYPVIEDVFHFTYVENTGAAFGILKDSRWFFMTVSVIAIVIIAAWLVKYGSEDAFLSICLSMVLGGGIGNMIDRVLYGYVVDFIDVRLINFAVFNIADSFVTVGAFLMIIYLLRDLILQSRNKKNAPDVGGGSDGGDDNDDGDDGEVGEHGGE